MKNEWAPLGAALMMPVISLCHIYAVNSTLLSISYTAMNAFSYVLIWAAAYGMARLVFRSSASALAACAALWLMMFLGGGHYWDLLLKDRVPYRFAVLLRYGLTGLLMLVAAYLLRTYRGKALQLIALAMCSVLLVMNFYPAVRAARAAMQASDGADDAVYKTTFIVDAEAQSPNVYWLHMDGMLGFSAFERFFGDDQAELVQALESRGFAINREAFFEGCHSTDIAFAALTNPDFYDREMAHRLADEASRAAMLKDAHFRYANVRGARFHNELMGAFAAKGYSSTMMTNLSTQLPPFADHNYIIMSLKDGFDREVPYTIDGDEAAKLIDHDLFSVGNVDGILEDTSGWLHIDMVSMMQDLLGRQIEYECGELSTALAPEELPAILFNGEDARQYIPLVQSLNDSLNAPSDSPRFSLVVCFAAHSPFIIAEDGSPAGGYAPGDLRLYPGQHRFAAKLMIHMIDMILERDPGAVIVLEADHGLHTAADEVITEQFGADALPEFRNQVMSAMRVPAGLQRGDEHFAMEHPLNLSRYLVNTFVGRQYDYLPAN